eukprot:CAMPEP_0202685538 /NCGR_PEP_ID=MMETSP1385-20130828/1326_1 /ASSEMBLY_ACC=CAM_ASM_000861 /TAXON_ID=933848 /ORGANISM="Elphidium margaritaceum" /LENGTH=269 /DNA_ID=CAMNT_0049339913 /DNA_START=48 /DNA_END=857 /DNA_ORIENTATION=+
MFECTLPQGILFRKIIQALSDVVEQGNFNINEDDGIYFQGMDSSHVSLVALKLAKDAFSEYRCDHDISLGIQFNSLGKILKCMGSKDSMSIQHDPSEDVANFVFINDKNSQISNFSLKLVEIDQEQLAVPETAYKSIVSMPSTEFQRVARDLSAIGDTIQISASKEGVRFAVTGDVGKGSTWLKSEANVDDDDEQKNITVSVEEPVQQSFSIKFINNFTKASSLSSTVTISMGPDVPLEICYNVESGGHLKFYLAPKIDDDVDEDNDME